MHILRDTQQQEKNRKTIPFFVDSETEAQKSSILTNIRRKYG